MSSGLSGDLPVDASNALETQRKRRRAELAQIQTDIRTIAEDYQTIPDSLKPHLSTITRNVDDLVATSKEFDERLAADEPGFLDGDWSTVEWIKMWTRIVPDRMKPYVRREELVENMRRVYKDLEDQHRAAKIPIEADLRVLHETPPFNAHTEVIQRLYRWFSNPDNEPAENKAVDDAINDIINSITIQVRVPGIGRIAAVDATKTQFARWELLRAWMDFRSAAKSPLQASTLAEEYDNFKSAWERRAPNMSGA